MLKKYLKLFLKQYKKRFFLPRKSKIRKQKQKKITNPIKKLQKRLREFYRNLSEDEKTNNKEIMVTLEIKKYQTQTEKEKKNI